MEDAAAFGSGPAGNVESDETKALVNNTEVENQQRLMETHIGAHKKADRATTTVTARRRALQNIRAIPNRFLNLAEAETLLQQADQELEAAIAEVDSTDRSLAPCIQGHNA